MSETVAMLVYLYPKTDRIADLRKILMDFVSPTRREAGCISYHLHEKLDGSDVVFVFYEIWRSNLDLDKHNKMPYISAFIQSEAEFLRKQIEIVNLHLLSIPS